MMTQARIVLVLDEGEAQRLYNALDDYLEDFWEQNDPNEPSDIKFNDGIRNIKNELEPYVMSIDDQTDAAANMKGE